MEDDHVDRPGVDAQQCVQLTGTNRSFGLIALVAKAREKEDRPMSSSSKKIQFCLSQRSSPAWWPSARRSDPIPSRTRPSNASAPMVLCLKTRESRSSPGLPRTFGSSTQTSVLLKRAVGNRQSAVGKKEFGDCRMPIADCPRKRLTVCEEERTFLAGLATTYSPVS